MDTNVLSSGLAGLDRPRSTPGEVVRAWERREFTLILSRFILDELDRTMRNAYFRQYRDLPSIAAMMQSIHERTTFVTIRFPLPRIASHIEDDAVIATAVQGGTDYLVTGDRALQQLERVERVRIVESGRECLPRLV